MRLQANDNVLVTKGRDRGKRGRITRVLPEKGRAVVEGVNVVQRHQQPTGAFRSGGIIEKELSVAIANLKFFCEQCDSPARIGRRSLPDGTKVRVCKKCGEVIE
ncbi:MAG: 50S ribosomal protein L24 [Dehalococcoidia bacterium]|nr:50S ribosomal protein L24 [Dehalococcoidia bacterium]